eukprot:GHVN01037022.1.p1 GENE.GHVN01037022.1~~GHVN01037022.1.p1  ORF type:complete len:299 (+),score=53.83 GHVN01037022.1:332-1228(+)
MTDPMERVLSHAILGVGPIYYLSSRGLKRCVILRLMICLLISFGFFWQEVSRDMANHYDLLDVPHTASKESLRRAHREIKTHLHEIVGGDSPEEAAYWTSELQKALSVLTTDTFKQNYHKFGDSPSAVMQSGDEEAVMRAVGVSLVKHLLIASIGCVFTLHQSHRGARTPLLLYTLGCMTLDLLLRFGDMSETVKLVPGINQLLTFEIIQLTRRIYPSLLFTSLTLNAFFGYLPDAPHSIVRITLSAILEVNRCLYGRVIEASYRMRGLTSLTNKKNTSAKTTSSGVTESESREALII